MGLELGYGGIDDPVRRKGYEPAGFKPLENPFYAALPYGDMERGRDYCTPTTGKSPTTSPSSSRLPYPALALSPTLNPLHESSANTPPKPSKKICRTMSISENPVRLSDARPMRPAQTRKQTMRVIVLVKATNDSEKGILPTTELLVAMGRYKQEAP
jgi:hypothetical protein